MLDVPRELIAYLAVLLQTERRRRGTRRGARLLTPFRQAVFLLAWFRDGGDVERLGAASGWPGATAYRYRDEGISVLAEQAPDLVESGTRSRSGSYSVVVRAWQMGYQPSWRLRRRGAAAGALGDCYGDVCDGALYVGEDGGVVGQDGAVPVLFGGDPVDLVAQATAVVWDQFDGVAFDGFHSVHDAAGVAAAADPRGPGRSGHGGGRGCGDRPGFDVHGGPSCFSCRRWGFSGGRSAQAAGSSLRSSWASWRAGTAVMASGMRLA